MEMIERRGMLKFFFAAGVTAFAGTALSRVEAATHPAGSAGDQLLEGRGGIASDAAVKAGQVPPSFESAVEPTQSIVIRPGRRRPVIVRPRPRPRPRLVCRRRRNGRLVCVRRF